MENLDRPIWPKEYKFCQACGGTDTIANDITQAEKDAGKCGGNVIAFLYQHQSLIRDTAKAALSAPMVTSYYDACSQCGTVRVVHVHVQKAMIGGPMPKQKPGQGFSTS